MTRPAIASLVLAIAIFSGNAVGSSVPPQASIEPPALSPALNRVLDPVIDALWRLFSPRISMAHVQYVSQFWRIGGNAGYDATIDYVRARLVEAGFAPATSASSVSPAGPARATTWTEQYPNGGKGWSYTVGTLAIARAGQPDEIVLSRDLQQIALCMNSFATPAQGSIAPLVDVGKGETDADYVGKNVKGAVVLGDASATQLWRFAVVARGAIGIVSTELDRTVSPDPPAALATPRERWDILQWGSVPYDEAHRAFGFKATPRAAAALRQALARGSGGSEPVRIHVTIVATFSAGPVRTLVAEIPGRLVPDERVVIAAHVQEPGANDNASGVATLTELARAMRLGVVSGRIPRPDRTMTFLWLEEISGSRQWLKDHPEEAKRVRYMFSMDMTGEDVRKTGGSFLIERWPDPGAVWDRPWDPHTDWGRGGVRAEQLKGDLINDLHLAICLRVARRTGWVVKTNPYEGGSDHTVFGFAGVPAVLDWHFTDRYYHTNFDTPDKTSPAEMRNVGVSVAASAWLLATANASTALDVASLVASAGERRLVVEEGQGPKLAAAEADPKMAGIRQAEIVATWRKWYGEAIRSVTRLVVGPVGSDFADRVSRLAMPFEAPRK